MENIKVYSKGLQATGDNIADNAKKVLKKLGASAANRKSVQLKKINPKFLYVTMSAAQRKLLTGAKAISYEDLIGKSVQDPYGQDLTVYEQTAAQLYQGVIVLIEKILKWEKSS